MSYVRIIEGIIEGPEFSDLPKPGPPDETPWEDRLPISQAQAEEIGIFEVIDVLRPADTALVIFERSLELLAGIPTVVWTQRNKTAIELKFDADQLKITKLLASIATLRSWANTARAATVTSGNAVATLSTVVKNLAEFYDGFADLLDQVIPKPGAPQ